MKRGRIHILKPKVNEYVTHLASTLRFPPDLPKFAVSDWNQVEKMLGFGIPDAYKEIFCMIGYGEWGGLLSLHSPSTIMACDLDRWKTRYSADFPQFAFFPDLPGLFQWGFTGSRTALFWDVTLGAMRDWSIVILELGFAPEKWEMGVPEFLWRHYAQTIESSLFPANLRSNPSINPL